MTDWPPVELALLDAALDYYGAAEAVIRLDGMSPRLHVDADGLHAVRSAMGLLEQRIHAAHAAGVDVGRIVSITRLEPELVAEILARPPRTAARGAEPGSRDGDEDAP